MRSIWNPATSSSENAKYVESIIDNSVITCDGIMDTIKGTSTETVPAKSTLTNFYILPSFLLITMTILIAVSIYCCFLKQRTKQKHLLPYCFTNSKLQEV